MSKKPLISVIMIFFNAELFIEEAIESVFAQTYDNWELLLVDDGSADRSRSIVEGYAGCHPERVRILEHPGHRNRGMSASRNLGTANSRGECIALLDADDVWLPGKLETQLSELESHPDAAMVYGPTQWWYSWNGWSEDRDRDYVHELGVHPNSLVQPPSLLVRFLPEEGLSPCTCSALIRRESFERVGGFEESFPGLYEDQAFFAKICLAAPVFASSECSARYRQHANSNCSMTQESGQHNRARPAFLKWLASYLTRQGVQDSEVWKALLGEMRRSRHPKLRHLIERARQGIPGKLAMELYHSRLRWPSLPVIRQLRCIQFRRLHPVGYGLQRGTPVVRHYWENYLQRHSADIRGTALEIGTTSTLRRLGGEGVASADAMDLAAHSPEITVVADLSRANRIPADRYDCFINQFTMHLIYDVEAALYHSVRILKPGGVLLVNFPCVDYYFPRGLDMGTGRPLFVYWWFTPIQVHNLLQRTGLSEADYALDVRGNLFARVAYQMNMPAEHLTRRELEYADPGHPLLICARVVKPASWQRPKPRSFASWTPDTTPAVWNPRTGHYALPVED